MPSIILDSKFFSSRCCWGLADDLGIEDFREAGYLIINIWTWAAEQTKDGVLPDNPRIVAMIVKWKGDPGALVAALVKNEILTPDYQIVGWEQILFSGPAITPSRKEWGAAKRILAPVVIQRDGAACRVCGATDNLTIDHIKPLSRGGKNEMSNFQVLCRPCNSRKGSSYDHDPEETR